MVYTATARCRQRDSLLTNGNFFFSLLLKKTAGLWNLMHNTDNSSQPMSACLWLISSTCHAEMAVNHSNCPKPKNCRTRCIVEVAAIPTRAQHLVYALEKGTAHYLFLYAFCIKSSHLHIQRYLWVGGWSVKASQKLGGFWLREAQMLASSVSKWQLPSTQRAWHWGNLQQGRSWVCGVSNQEAILSHDTSLNDNWKHTHSFFQPSQGSQSEGRGFQNRWHNGGISSQQSCYTDK